jgi:hypothetical protein
VHEVSEQQLIDQFGGPPISRHIHRELNRLLADGYVEKIGNAFKSRAPWLPIHQNLIAIELKLNRINEALEQARRHTVFATESYVAMPSDVATRVTSRAAFSDFADAGVGVIAVSATDCEIVLACDPSNYIPDSGMQAYVADRFWTKFKTNSAA